MRSASTYRGARRNAARRERGFPEWKQTIAFGANQKADLAGRQKMAEGAAKAAAKALVGMKEGRPDIVANMAMLSFYRAQKRGRAVSRIRRDLEKRVRAAS